jgi:hypothetical protein
MKRSLRTILTGRTGRANGSMNRLMPIKSKKKAQQSPEEI